MPWATRTGGALVFLLAVVCSAAAARAGEQATCEDCHREETPSIVHQWAESRHAEAGVQCLSCHSAQAGESDAYEHYGETVATIVSPKDCSLCHPEPVEQYAASRHADAARFVETADNFLGFVLEGEAAVVRGCEQCHGSRVEVDEDGRPTARTWPNTGAGRVNPDGSRGSCSACHTRHAFSIAQARRPEGCGRCHMGPDHPQMEVFEESKHGVLFHANRTKMNLASREWVLGVDYSAAPTCATCHMGATPDQEPTHNAGTRLAWTLRPVVSKRHGDWREKRSAMRNVCHQCHTSGYVDGFFRQFDDVVELYNRRFGRPARRIMSELREEGLLTEEPFDEKIEWTFFELWHHEGRRARAGAAMMGQDFVQWHGFYEVAKHFYGDFLEQAEQLKPGITDEVARPAADAEEPAPAE
ncbi:MAG: multiheme c-type cytochrome [Planctomycetota bacterium]